MSRIIHLPTGKMPDLVFYLTRIFVFVSAICMLGSTLQARSLKDKEYRQIAAGDTTSPNTIHQEIDFTVSPQKLYEALLDSKEFSDFASQTGEFSAKSAVIDRVPGGAFSLFEGHIIGRIIEMVPNKRIVQVWRVVDWPEGIYSIVRFDFEPKEGGTRLKFEQIGFPEKLKDHLADGWQSHYWDLLKKYLH